MDRRKKTKKKRKFKQFLAILIIIFFIFFVFYFVKERTIFLKKEDHIIKTTAQTYIFKDEEYININTQNKIKFIVDEGSKVGSNTLLSETYKITTTKYFDEAIDVINWRISNGTYYIDKKVYTEQLASMNKEVSSLEDSLAKAKAKQNNDEQIEELTTKLDAAKYKALMMDRSSKYIFADTETLTKLKGEYEQKKSVASNNLTATNLNFSFSGNIYCSANGYETILSKKILPAISESYFIYVDSVKPKEVTTTRDNVVIKITSTNFIYLCAFVPKDTYVADEVDALNQKEAIYSAFDLDAEGGYYEFLERRIDAYMLFPTIRFSFEKNEFAGKLVDVQEYEDKGKLLIIAIRNKLDPLLTQTIIDVDMYTEEITAYVVPKKAIIEQNDKTYLYVMKSGYFKELVEVEVFRYAGKKAILRPSNNPDLYENLEVIINP